jgi:hypothetical protein
LKREFVNAMTNLVDPTKIDPTTIADSAWEFDKFTEDGGRMFIFWIDRENGTYITKKENTIEPELLAMNKQHLDDSQGKRFGDGKVVSRIPLNIYYRDIVPRLDDPDHKKWWLNSEQGRPYKTFRGKI